MGREAFDIAGSAELDLERPDEAMRADHMRRLKVQLEELMRAIEAIDPPKDHAGVEKFAKAISAVNKAVRDVNAPEKDRKPQSTEDEDMSEDKIKPGMAINSSGDPKYDGLFDWQIELERKLDRLADARRASRVADERGGEDRSEDSP